MADDLTPGQVRARQFDIARKGYERAQVDAFLAQLADRVADLESRLDATGRDVAIGIDEEQALARELHTIGEQVGEILESARAAAEGMRTRASEDASTWRNEAETSSTSMLDDATEQSHTMRAAAWNEGSSLLASAAAEAEAIVVAAKEEALFVRAEAEREALRLTGDAKRDREETIRASRMEADQIVEAARTESDGVLAAAAQQAELAQERARALEDRRSELLAELEATRASISDLEQEIDSRRRELEEPEPEPEPEPERSHHGADGGSVRIVASSNVVELEPVDADSLVAEVEALRRSDDDDGAVRLIPQTQDPVAQPVAQPVAGIGDDAPDVNEFVAAPVETEDPEPAAVETAEDAALVVDVEPQPEPEPEPEPEPAVDEVAVEEAPADDGAGDDIAVLEVPDDLGALFAQLREPTADPAPEPASDPEPPTVETTAVVDDADRAPAAAASTEPEPTPEPTPEPEPSPATDLDASAAAIPAQNAALRTIKRTLVDLQNETLEHLRTDPDWSPDEAFTDRFAVPFDELAATLGAGVDPGAGAAFGTDLYDALTSALDHARDAGSGDREVAAAASKVFRTWRSDEAERRVFGAVGATS